MYTDTEISNAIATAKCCYGDYSCNLMRKGMNGIGYDYTLQLNTELSLIIFALTMHTNHDCLEDDEVDKMIHRINRLCECNDCTNSSSTSSTIGVHTTSTHTSLTHTE